MQRRTERGMGPSFYEEWIEKEGIPIAEGTAGIEDILELPRRPWARMGGLGTFIQIEGAKQAYKGLYVAEIPAGGALEPEKHLYDELIYIWRGRGLTEVWHEGKSKRTFEWGEGSLFAMPTNTWHRMVNGGREPVLFFAVTSAPAAINTFRNTEFIFNCDYNFTDRYTGQDDYFLAAEKRTNTRGKGFVTAWWTNFVPDLRTAFLDDFSEKAGPGGTLTAFSMASWGGGHASEWPVGRYHKCHSHGPGAILMGMKSKGFVLVWPERYGPHPYQDGHGDKVAKMNWKAGSIYSPYGEFGMYGNSFHQHFNTGPEPARHLAVTGGGVGGGAGHLKGEPYGDFGKRASIREGGIQIEFEDEDPEIRRMFLEDLRQSGVECAMPPVTYRTDPIPSI